MRQRRFLEAETYLRGALGVRENWYGRAHPHVAEVLNDLAGLLSYPGNVDRSVLTPAQGRVRWTRLGARQPLASRERNVPPNFETLALV